jgi:hypothetical protein
MSTFLHFLLWLSTVTGVIAMSAVHEQMQQRAQQQQRIGQDAKDVGRVLSHQKESADEQETDQRQTDS